MLGEWRVVHGCKRGVWLHVKPLFFFFQAEDGIRDLTVTGVQTCALPIFHQAEEDKGAGKRQPAQQRRAAEDAAERSEEHTSELQSQSNLVCRLLLEKKKQALHFTSPRPV